jgi:hypothetical protein
MTRLAMAAVRIETAAIRIATVTSDGCHDDEIGAMLMVMDEGND